MCIVKPTRVQILPPIRTVMFTRSLHVLINFDDWQAKLSRQLTVERMIGKTSQARNLSASAKKDLFRHRMKSPPGRNIGARQYARAMALKAAQEEVKVQQLSPIGDAEKESDNVRKITWGSATTLLVDYDIPFANDQGNMTTTERMMKKETTKMVKEKLKDNILQASKEKTEWVKADAD